MKRFFTLIFASLAISLSAQRPASDKIETLKGSLEIQPINHAAMVLTWDKKTIYVDPFGGAKAFEGMAAPDLILITDIHPDHLDLETLKAIDTKKATFIVPQAVADKMPAEYKTKLVILANTKSTTQKEIAIKAIAMYNFPETPDAMHTKGRGNGYILTLGGKTVYISGDTGPIPEMLALKNIDIAFVCMNLPYTMDVPQAAIAVLAFKPKIVYPYHFRGKDGMSDTSQFKQLVDDAKSGIDVRLRNWYWLN